MRCPRCNADDDHVHVTQSLGAVPPWRDLYARVPYTALEEKRALGVAVHAATHFHDDNDLDMATVDPAIMPYLEGWIAFKWQCRFEPQEREIHVYHPVYGYRGTLDALGLMKDEPALVDLKCSEVDPRIFGPQTAAYLEAWQYQTNDRTPRTRWCVQLGRGTYRVAKHSNRRDFNVFLATLEIYNFSQPWRREL